MADSESSSVKPSSVFNILSRVLDHPKMFFMGSLLVVIFFAVQLMGLGLQPSTYLLDSTHPARVAEAAMGQTFTATGTTISVVIEPKEGSILTDTGLEAITTLTQQLQNLTLLQASDEKQLMRYTIDTHAEKLINDIVLGGLKHDDVQAINDLYRYLSSNMRRITEDDHAFFQKLPIIVDPVTRVRSLTTTEDMSDNDDTLEINPVLQEIPRSEIEMAQFIKYIESNPLVHGAFVSYDNKAAIVVVELNVSSDDAALISRSYQAVKAIVAGVDNQFIVNIGGIAVATTALNDYMKIDNDRFFPLVLLVIVIVLALSFRRVEGIYIPLLIAISSLICAMGMLPLFGIKQNMITSTIPIFVMATAVADAIHFLNHFYKTFDANGHQVRQAIETTYQSLFKALTFTTITSALGFLSLAYTEVVFIREFGVFVAAGIVFAYLFTIIMLPATLMLRPNRKVKNQLKLSSSLASRLMNTVTEGIVILAIKKRMTTLITFCLVLLAALFYAQTVRVDYETISLYPEDADIRLADAAIKSRFEGVVPLSILLNGTDNGAIYSQEVISYIDAVENVLSSEPHVGYILTPNSYLKRMNQILNNGEMNQLPENMESTLASQYYLLYDNSDSQDIRDLVDTGYQNGRIVVLLDTDRATVVKDIIAAIQPIPVPVEINVDISGAAGISYKSTEAIVYGQVGSLAISAVLVLSILVVLFRSFVIGIVAVIPLVFTLCINFGVLGFVGWDLGIATSLIAAIVLGVGIDYGIHFVQASNQYRAEGLDKTAALQKTIKSVCPPVIINSLTLACGFLVLAISNFQPLIHLGLLVSMTMIVSGITTSIVLPILLSYVPEKSARGEAELELA